MNVGVCGFSSVFLSSLGKYAGVELLYLFLVF